MEAKIHSHKDLDVWKKSIILVKDIYKTTSRFPKEEQFGITQQMRRSAISIPSNIAEGAGRGSKKEFVHFLAIAQGSLAELETQLIISNELEIIHGMGDFEARIMEIRMMLGGLTRKLQQ